MSIKLVLNLINDFSWLWLIVVGTGSSRARLTVQTTSPLPGFVYFFLELRPWFRLREALRLRAI